MPAKHGRNVALTDEHDAFIEHMVSSGRYASASEVVRDGLRALQRDEERRLLEKWFLEGLSAEEAAAVRPDVLKRLRDALREKIQEGLEQAQAGELVGGDEFMARWRARLDEAATRDQE